MNKIVDFQDRSTIGQQAAAWLIRLDGDGKLSSEEQRALEAWLRRNPAHGRELRRLAKLWDNMNILTELAVPLVEDGGAARRPGHIRFSRKALTAIAACLVAGIAVSILLIKHNDSDWRTNGLYATAVGQQRSVDLEDGSTMTLNTDTQVRVEFGSEYRDIELLQGEAHFVVATNPVHPFRVSAGRGRIRAVGTTFSVYLRTDSVEVAVTEGSVAVEAVNSNHRLTSSSGKSVLSASYSTPRELGFVQSGEVATIQGTRNDSLEQIKLLRNTGAADEAELSRRLSWTEGVLYFSGEPLADVVREISRYTKTQIEFADAETGAIRIGGRFPVGETETMLDALEETFGLRVEYLADDRVIISTKTQ